MEGCPAFQRIIIERENELDVVKGFNGKGIGALIFECTNLITFRSNVQIVLRVSVYNAASLIEFFGEGYRQREFINRYMI